MLKQILLLVVFSVVAILFKHQLAIALKFLVLVHTQIAHGLGVIFSFDQTGEVVQSVLALLFIPIVLAILVAVAHFFIRKAHFPHVVTVVWFIWAVLLTSLVSHTVYVHHMVNDEEIHLMHKNGPLHSHTPAPAPAPANQAAAPTPQVTQSHQPLS